MGILKIKEDINIVKDFTNAVKNKLVSLEHEMQYKTKSYEIEAYSSYLQDIKSVLFTQVQQNLLTEKYDKKALKKFVTETGIVSNELLISMSGIPVAKLHDLADVDEFLDKLEQGTITKREKSFIFQEDYAERYLKYYNNGEFEKAREIIKYIKPESINDLFRKHNVGVESIMLICNEMINAGIRKDKISAEVEKLVYIDKKKANKTLALTPQQILKFVEADFLLDTYLMDAYHTQQKMKEEIEQKSPSVKLYKQDEIFVNETDIKTIFSASRLLKHYLKEKNFQKALAFYYE